MEMNVTETSVPEECDESYSNTSKVPDPVQEEDSLSSSTSDGSSETESDSEEALDKPHSSVEHLVESPDTKSSDSSKGSLDPSLQPQVNNTDVVSKSDQQGSRSQTINKVTAVKRSIDSTEDSETEQEVYNGIMSLVSVSLEVEEPQQKKRKLNHSSEPANKEKAVKSSKQQNTTAAARSGNHECIFCQKTFRDKYHMTRHLFVHAGEKAPDCTLCKKPRDRCGCEPYQPILVKQHKCGLCGKTFRDKYHLNRHVFVHTREKPFKCMFCDKHFSRKDKLTQHTVQHT